MLTIKEIEQRIQTSQSNIEAENRAAEYERTTATTYRQTNDINQAQAHEQTAMNHEQKSVQLQGEIGDLMNEQQRLQADIAALDQKKAGIIASKDQELASIDSQIDKIKGGA